MDRDEWNACWSGTRHPDHHEGWDWDVPDELFTAQVPERAGSALDLGCGAGANAVWLARHGWRVMAVDYARAALERTGELAARHGVTVGLIEADLRVYQPEGSFDLVSLCYVHLEPAPRRQLLQAAVRALAPGARLVFLGHDRSDAALRERYGLDAANMSTPDEIVAALGGGVMTIRAEVVEARLHGGDDAALTTLVVARRKPEDMAEQGAG